MPHIQHALAGFTSHGKGFGKKLIQNGFAGCEALSFVFNSLKALVYTLAEFVRLGAQLLVGKLLHPRFKRVDLAHNGAYPLDLAFITCAKYLGKCFLDQFASFREKRVSLKA